MMRPSDSVTAIDVGGTTVKATTVDRSGRRGPLLRRATVQGAWRAMPTLFPAAFGEHAGLMGAALLASEAVRADDPQFDSAAGSIDALTTEGSPAR